MNKDLNKCFQHTSNVDSNVNIAFNADFNININLLITFNNVFIVNAICNANFIPITFPFKRQSSIYSKNSLVCITDGTKNTRKETNTASSAFRKTDTELIHNLSIKQVYEYMGNFPVNLSVL